MIIFCLLMGVFCSPVFTEQWKASLVNSLDALVTSCVVLPCTFTQPKDNLPTSRLRGIWHLKTGKDQIVYQEDMTRILENFRGRTKLLGQLGQKNCSLEMIDIKDHDNGPFCFRIELVENANPTVNKFSFVEDCVSLKMLPEPPKPTLIPTKTVIEGHPYTITCSVTHTCPSHVPTLSWNRKDPAIIESHREIHTGIWEAQSILTFTVGEKDDHTDVTCTAQFYGKKTSSAEITLYVKRIENLNHIIIPCVVGIGTAVIFGVLCIFMVKKYKTRITELQNQDGSMWNRVSRMSRRVRSGVTGRFHSDQRRSIWSRFSRRPMGGTGDLGHTRNNEYPKSCGDQTLSKPRFPSPKSQPKSCNYKEDLDDGDDYINTADLNVYGNI
ncbi:myelin-associated glycoprotein [Channa argus]|uniref:myelin-associated glycoprotein n=1 Tax=Channa argus TaxID=215402 RepID=UPI0029468B38|nr:hypothetical protein Q8A73_008102 [Channa argus]